jgi:hypothetical protein
MPGRLEVVAAFALVLITSTIGLPLGGRVRGLGAAHADSAVPRLSPALTARPVIQGDYNCTVTQGYWRNHPESWNRVASLTLGTVANNQTQLLVILVQPVAGNGLVQLAHQLITAKLNLLLGAVPPPEVTAAIAEADALIGPRVVPPIGSDGLKSVQTAKVSDTLSLFNIGNLGPGHCPHALDFTSVDSPTWGTLKVIYR